MRMTKTAACLLAGAFLPAGVANAATTDRTGSSTVWPMTSRTQVAQAKTSQGSEQVKTLSPQAPVSMPQPVGSFPTNAVTDRPYRQPRGRESRVIRRPSAPCSGR